MADAASTTAPQKVRLYAKGLFLGYQRSQRYQRRGTTIIRIEGCNDQESARFYAGKRVAFVYKAKTEKFCPGHRVGSRANATKVRCIWGKVTRPHGGTGAVRAQFRVNLPPRAIGAPVRVMLYPSSI